MKFLVISTRINKDVTPLENITVCAELNNFELAQRLKEYYNSTDKGQHAEIHPVMNDLDAEFFLMNAPKRK